MLLDFVGRIIFTALAVLSWTGCLLCVLLSLAHPVFAWLVLALLMLGLWSSTFLLVDAYLASKSQTK